MNGPEGGKVRGSERIVGKPEAVAQALVNAQTVHVDFRRFAFSGYSTPQAGLKGCDFTQRIF
jgi:hypothetical protein